MALLVNIKKLINSKGDVSEKATKTEEQTAGPVVMDEARKVIPENVKREKIALLTPRERELLSLLLEGLTLQQSADRMSVRYPTANTHITSIYRKLEVSSRAELIIKYRDMND